MQSLHSPYTQYFLIPVEGYGLEGGLEQGTIAGNKTYLPVLSREEGEDIIIA